MANINWEQSIMQVIQNSDMETVSFKYIQTRMKEQSVECEQKQLIEIVKRYDSLKTLQIEGKKSMRNPHYQAPQVKARGRTTAANTRAAMAKVSERPVVQNEHQLEEVKRSIQAVHQQLSNNALEEIKTAVEQQDADVTKNELELLQEAVHIELDEELLHDQYKSAFHTSDWQGYLSSDVERVVSALKGGCQMGHIQLLLANERFCEEKVRLCKNDVFKIIHVSLKLTESQKTQQQHVREVQQSNLQWLCSSVAVREYETRLQSILKLIEIKK